MKKEVKFGLAVAIIVGLIALSFDAQISVFVASLRGLIPSFFFIGFTFEIQTFIVLFFLTSLFLFQEQKRRWILPLWLTAALAIVISFILKYAIARPRPFDAGIVSVLTIAYHLIGGMNTGWNFSFPSFQAVLAFSAIPILSKEFRKFKWVWVAIATIIAFSRVYFGLHYASDVIFGAVIGYFLGYFMVKLEQEYEPGKKLIKKLRLSK